MDSGQLLWSISHLASQGRCVFTVRDLVEIEPGKTFAAVEKSIQRLCFAGLVSRAYRGVYVLADNGFDSPRLLEEIAAVLRPDSLNYLSFESALAVHGRMPPVPAGIVTVATTGPKGLYSTEWGVVELTHVKHSSGHIRANTVSRKDGFIPAAAELMAIEDQRALGRNWHMLNS